MSSAFILRPTCARRDDDVHQRMNANGHDNAYFKSMICILVVRRHLYNTSKTLNNPRLVHDGSSSSCLTLHAIFSLLHEAVVPSSVGG
jgi:hypothetical protein